MSTAEQLGQSLLIEERGVHALLWSDMEDLARALVAVLATLENQRPIKPFLVTGDRESSKNLRNYFESPGSPSPDDDDLTESPSETVREEILAIFVQQATSLSSGPWLNGWRNPLSAPPGSLLILRNPDFTSLQRSAPDLASFVGPRIYDSASMMSLWSEDIAGKLDAALPLPFLKVLEQLPGSLPDETQLRDWIKYHSRAVGKK